MCNCCDIEYEIISKLIDFFRKNYEEDESFPLYPIRDFLDLFEEYSKEYDVRVYYDKIFIKENTFEWKIVYENDYYYYEISGNPMNDVSIYLKKIYK